jgi:hypothetical protein
VENDKNKWKVESNFEENKQRKGVQKEEKYIKFNEFFTR